jgi:hypothetical protein
VVKKEGGEEEQTVSLEFEEFLFFAMRRPV